MKRKLVIVALVLMLNPLTLLFLAIGGMWWSDTHPDTGVNVPSVGWLPESASNVSFYRTYSWTAYEFDIDEAGFREWARRFGGELEPFSDGCRIERYSWREFCRSQASTTVDGDAYYEEERKHYAYVRNGLCYRYINERNGGGVHVVYDRDAGRAYCQSNPR